MSRTLRPLSPSKWLARLVLVAFGLCLGMVLAEGFARWLAPDGAAELLFPSTDNTPIGLYVTSPTLGTRPAAGFVGTTGAGVNVRINALGLRGPEILPDKHACWLVLGDSFVMALQVQESETFVEKMSQSSGVDVLNGGVDGYSTVQATARLDELARGISLDGVFLVFFTGNDFQDNERVDMRLREARQLPDGTPTRQPVPSTMHRLFSGWSRLYGHLAVWQRRRAILAGADPVVAMWAQELLPFHRSGAGALNRSVQTTREALRRFYQNAQSRGIPVIVAVAPPAFAVHTERAAPTLSLVGLDPQQADLEAPERAVMGALQSLGVPSCPLGPPLRAAAARGEKVYLTFDGHWSAAGHAVVADALLDCAVRAGWSPSAPTNH